MPTALILAGGGFQGLPVLRALHALGWQTVIADSIPDSVNAFECGHFVTVPPLRRRDEFTQAIRSIVQAHRVAAVFGTTDHDLPVLASLKPELEALGAQVFASSEKLLLQLSDKADYLAAARDAGLPVLPFVDPHTHDFSFPLIAKPVHGWGGKDVRKIADRAQAQILLESGEPHLWQPFLSDLTEWSVDFAINGQREISPLVIRKRLRMSGGFAVVTELHAHAHITLVAQKTAEWLASKGGSGLFNIQFLQDMSGEGGIQHRVWLSDVNARAGTSAVAAELSGTNLVAHLLGKACNPPRAGLVIRTLKDRFLPRMDMNLRGVVFDLDETLICQKSWMRDKADIVFSQIAPDLSADGLAKFKRAVLQAIDEGPWDRLLDVAVARSGIALSPRHLIDLWRGASPDRVSEFADALGLIDRLAALKIPMALITDNPAASQKLKLSRFSRRTCFERVIFTDEIGAPKPDKTAFLAAAEFLDIPTDALAMIGDSPWRDAAGALGAGYGAAIVILRQGQMTNSKQQIYTEHFPDLADKTLWTDSLHGMERAFSALSGRV